jgi:hypothetical protein
MALVLAVASDLGNAMRYAGGSGVSDNDLVVQTGNVAAYDEFILQSTAGAMDVYVSLDGTNYSTAALSLIDMGATTSDPVIESAANRTYAFFGTFALIRILQKGATAVAGATLMCKPRK